MQICGCCHGNISVCLILGQQNKKKPKQHAISGSSSHVAGAEVETTSVWTGFRRQRENTEHLVAIHYSLQMSPHKKKQNYQMLSRLMKVCMQRWGTTSWYARLSWLHGPIEISRRPNHWGNTKNVEDFVFFSVNFRPGKLVGNSSLFFPLKREKNACNLTISRHLCC